MSKKKSVPQTRCCDCHFYVPHWEPLIASTPRPGNESRATGTFVKLRCGHCECGSRKMRDAQHIGCQQFMWRE